MAANAVIDMLDRWPNTSVADDSIPVNVIPIQLEGKSEIVSNEQELISARCRSNNHQAFEQLKKEGIENRIALEYEAAAAAFENAFKLCAAPEVKIAFNNATIGSRLARNVVVTDSQERLLNVK